MRVKRLGMAIMQYSHTVPVTTTGRPAAALQTSDEALVQLIAGGDANDAERVHATIEPVKIETTRFFLHSEKHERVGAADVEHWGTWHKEGSAVGGFERLVELALHLN